MFRLPSGSSRTYAARGRNPTEPSPMFPDLRLPRIEFHQETGVPECYMIPLVLA